ncbi:hypothetical protein TVAG_029080 [Trichomonas vaginalis G3]|uniref:Uncharacterized protein n=1 Tax=Trichomonas vaginalis (strain ATCC PRA-98 / G3) TaxID=412133 RepID=A2F500_TRIV3|nr:hypothetical protein TVAGG3_0594540 [Trichomonas vaginalis G3]EAY00004.1 hypothetical protein TVAG_029080 [Trichomonas vaginalis G3]KAI5523507.1 hypothetical protein TVAGG3_0594540 [Trichomonas vaginalis G3]|eukprot:XP_001312933.1 hypothetical protein [Trichomonas vaginalis G3]
MIELPHVAGLKQIHPFETTPTSMMISSKNEVMFFYSGFQYFNVFSIEPFQEKIRFFTSTSMDSTCIDVRYMDATDSFTITQLNTNSKQYNILYVTNWRNGTKSAFLPKLPYVPANWEFMEPFANNLSAYLIGQFQSDVEPIVEISGNSTILCTSSTFLIWDFEDRPVFRCAVLMPRFDRRPLFCFQGNTIALSVSDRIFIIRLEQDSRNSNTTPFTPGTKCFELGERLDIDFGLTDEGANALFLVRSLPNKKYIAKTVFNICLPAELISVKALSEKSFVFLTKHPVIQTENPVILLTQRDDKFILEQFTEPCPCTSIDANRDFVVLSGESNVRFIPNPERNNEHFDEGIVTALDESRFFGLKCVCTNNDYCALLSCTNDKSDQKSDIRILKFDDPIAVGLAALKSPQLKDKKAAIRLMGAAAPEFARAALDIGNQLLAAKDRNVEAVRYLVTSFNVKDALSKEERSSVISSIKKLPSNSTARREFLRFAKFNPSEIDDEICKMLQEDSYSLFARKLMEAGKFDINVDERICPEAELYNAVSLSLKNQHEKAKNSLVKIAKSDNLKNLPDLILEQISKDIPPPIIVMMGRTDLECDSWSKDEIICSSKFYNDDLDFCINYVIEKDDSERWHYNEWPKKPLLCQWAGDIKSQFISGCAVHKEIHLSNEKYSWAVDAVNFAKKKQFGEGLKVISPNANKLNYIRMFAKTALDWTLVADQSNDQLIKEIALHEFILLSPRNEYSEALKKVSNSEISEIANKMREADNELLKALVILVDDK